MQCYLCRHVVPRSNQTDPVGCSLSASEKNKQLMLLSAEVDQCRQFVLTSKVPLNIEAALKYR